MTHLGWFFLGFVVGVVVTVVVALGAIMYAGAKEDGEGR